MNEHSTSVYANAWRAIYRLLLEEDWPNLKLPSVEHFVFGCTYGAKGPPKESVLIVTSPDENLDQVWGPIGELRKDEKFVVQLVVATLKPHATWLEALSRLEELTAVVERMFHRTARAQTRATDVPELDGVLKNWSVATVIPEVLPMSDGKFGAIADLRVLVEARIKPTSPS